MSKKAFILIDYSNDLIAPDGILSCAPATLSLVPVVCDYMQQTINEGNFVVVCNDVHQEPDKSGKGDPYHPETALFPSHNVKNRYGSSLYPAVAEKWAQISAEHPFETTYFEKMRFSAFVGTKLDIWLRSRDVTEVVLAGVCTDICVFHTAIEAYGKGYKVTILEKGCCSTTPENHQFAIDHCKNLLGATIL